MKLHIMQPTILCVYCIYIWFNGNHIYAKPLLCLQTVEKKPREIILCREFANSVAYLNHVLPKSCRIKFTQWDFHMFSRR